MITEDSLDKQYSEAIVALIMEIYKHLNIIEVKMWDQ